MKRSNSTEPKVDELYGRQLGEFIVGERIDGGGNGNLYRCYQPTLQRHAVIKVLRKRGNQEAEIRFAREAKLASRLDHPFAAHIYASGIEEDGLRWIAMEFVPGVTFEQWLNEHGLMPLARFVLLIESLANAVFGVHERGMVHRDLKPANVMVTDCGGRDVPRLLDFGLAKLMQSSQPDPCEPSAWPDGSLGENYNPTELRAVGGEVITCTDPTADERLTPLRSGMGTWPYMSPEQWDDPHAVDAATDVYALGILSYRALNGHLPFTGSTKHEWKQLHLHAEVPPVGGDLPAALDRVFRRALAKNPEDRYKSALELAAAFREVWVASEQALLSSHAQQWDAHARPTGLLLGRDVLANVESWTRRAPPGVLTKLECSYVAESYRRVRHSAWLRSSAVALVAVSVAVSVLVAFVVHERSETQLAQEQARSAQRVADAVTTQAELDQGQALLLHGEPDAEVHLAEAYRRGERSPSTAFMLARALQPRVAEQARFSSTFGRMWSADFSPDGHQIITTDDKSIQLWDAQSKRLLVTLPQSDTVYSAVYSADGTRFVTAGGDGTAKIWNSSNGHLMRELRHDGPVRRYYIVAWSPNNEFVAAIDTQGAIAHVWNAGTGEALSEIHMDGLEFASLAFSADGRWLAATGGNNVYVVDTRTWKLTLTIRAQRVHCVAFDPRGWHLLTGSANGAVAIWDIPTGAKLRQLREGGEPVGAVAFSRDGSLATVGSRDGAAQVWSASSGELVSQFNAHHSKILSMEFDRTSKLVLASGSDGSVVVADAASGMPVTTLEGPQNIVWVAHFDPSSRWVVAASWDGTSRVWAATSPYRQWSSQPMSDDCGIVTSAEPDRRFTAISCGDRGTRIWDTSRDQLLAELPGVSKVDGDFISAFPAVSSTGDRAAIARGSVVEIYEIPSGRLLHEVKHTASVNAVDFAPTGRDIVSGATDGSLIVTRDSGAQLVLPRSAGGIDATTFLADGRIVASNEQRRLRVYSSLGAVLADFEIPARAMSLRSNGDHLITIPIYTGTAVSPALIDLTYYRTIARLDGHVGRVFSARWVSSNRIVTAGADGSARLWDGATGGPRQVYRGSRRFLADATLSPDGQMVVGGDGDGMLRFWDLATGRQLWKMQAHKTHLVGLHFEGTDLVTHGFDGGLARWRLPTLHEVIGACGEQCRRSIISP